MALYIPGDAQASQVLSGKKFSAGTLYNADGTMVDHASITDAVSVGTSVTYPNNIYVRIPDGGYLQDATSGYPEIMVTNAQLTAADADLVAGNILQGKNILGISGTATSDANAVAADILSTKTAYVNGLKITGSMANRSSQTNAVSLGISGTTIYTRINGGAYVTNAGSGYPEIMITNAQLQALDADFVAANFPDNKNIFGIQGTMPNRASAQDATNIYANSSGDMEIGFPTGAYLTGSGWGAGTASVVVHDTDFIAANIRSDKNIFGIQGSIPVITSGSDPAQGVGKWPDGSLAVYPSEGYRKGGAGAGEIKVTPTQLQSAEADLTAGNIRAAAEIFGITGSMVERQYAAGTVSPDAGTYTANFRNGGGSFVRISVTGLGFNPNIFRVRFKAGGTWSTSYMGDIWGYGLGCFTSWWGVGSYWEQVLIIADGSTDLQMSSSLCRAFVGQGTITEVTWEAWA